MYTKVNEQLYSTQQLANCGSLRTPTEVVSNYGSQLFFFLLKQKKQESYGFYHFLES